MNARLKVVWIAVIFSTVWLAAIWLPAVEAASSTPMTLSFSSWGTEKDPALPAWQQMGKDLEQATQGKVKLKFYHAETLGKAKEHYELALKGIADIAYLNVSFTPGRFPVTDLLTFSYAPSGEAMADGMTELMKKGYLAKEYENVKLLYAYTGTPNHFLWRKGTKPATTLAELRGKKIRIPGTAARDLITTLGATPMNIPMPEVYPALERGVIDGAFTSLVTLDVFRLAHVCQEITKVNFLTFAFAIVINKQTWEKLPEEAKSLLQKRSADYALLSTRSHDQNDAKAIEHNKPKIYPLPASDLKRMKEIVAPSLKAYINKYEASGYPMKKAARDYHQFMKQKYGAEPYLAEVF